MLRIARLSLLLVLRVPKKFLESQLSQQANAFLSPWTGCDKKERDEVREMKEKERERRALLSCVN